MLIMQVGSYYVLLGCDDVNELAMKYDSDSLMMASAH